MAWIVDGNNLTMAEEDFGVGLPFEFQLGATLGANDTMQFVFKRSKNAEALVTKTFDSVTDNKVELVLTEEDSAKLPVGVYVYRLDWYQNGSFMDNLIPCATLKVVDKA